MPKSHSGVVTLLHQHFVQTDKFDFTQASFYSRLMQERIEEDYSDNITGNDETTRELIGPAQNYVSYIEKLIEQYSSEQTGY